MASPSYGPEIGVQGYSYVDTGETLWAETSSINFKVTTCMDALVGVMDDTGLLYEIVIGGWSNTKSSIG